MEYPTYADVLAARDFTRPYLPETPLIYSWKLSQLLGCEYYIKCENMQPVGAFKVRGGVNLVGNLSVEERAAGMPAPETTVSHWPMQGISSTCRLGSMARPRIPIGIR